MIFINNPYKKKLKACKELLKLGKKILNYRGDILVAADHDALSAQINTLESAIKLREDEKTLDRNYNELDKIMKQTGGDIYPVKFIPDNCEVILVAAILAIGIRTFFLQPFAIPTNSMYPTYNGMTSAVYTEARPEPSLVQKAWNFLTLGAVHHELTAPSSGEVTIPINPQRGSVDFKQVIGRKWLILPTPKREYTLYVDGEPASIVLPWDYSLEEVIQKTFYPEMKDFSEVVMNALVHRNFKLKGEKIVLKPNKYIKRGEALLNFDILTGDMLFVDRFTYHFKQPQIGDPFVFKTKNIKDYPEDKYFIKRLVGLPGDKLEVKAPLLYRNDEPIQGAEAFDLNANKMGEYKGYTNQWRLSKNKVELVPNHHYYAMGDNSQASADSRVWGFVPEKEVIGKAYFIFYPFSHRWGISK